MSRLALLLALAVPATALAADPKPEELKTVRYDVADLRKSSSGKTDTAEQIATSVAEAVDPDAWKVGAKSGHRLRIVGEDALEVRTTAANHKQIAELVQALRQLNDLAVDLSVSVFAIDRKTYEKEFQAKLKTGPVVATEDQPLDIGKGLTPVATFTRRLWNGRTAVVHTDRQAVTYRTPSLRGPDPLLSMPETKVDFTGVTLTVGVLVSADRRFVKVSTTEVIRSVSGVTAFKREVRVPTFAGRKDAPKVAIVEKEFQSVGMRDETVADERVVPDADRLVLPLRFVSPDSPDKVLVAVVRPVIFIQAEEDERKKK